MSYTCTWYIEHNDFEGALERFNETTKQWKRHWFETCETIAKNCIEWTKKYILDPISLSIETAKEIIKYTKTRRCSGFIIPMNYLSDCGEDVKGQQTLYLFKFYNSNHEIIFSKIGTTKVSVNERLRQEVAEYLKKFDVASVDVCKIYDCGEMPAESYESFLRATLIKKYPNTWHKNDRFFGVNIPTETFTTLCDTFTNM